LSQQPWLKEKFSGLFAYIASKFDLDEDTPIHNAMQLKWCDKGYLARLLYGVWACSEVPPNLNEFDGSDIVRVVPEHLGWDIYFEWKDGRGVSENYVELKPTLGDNYPGVLRTMNAKKTKRSNDASYYLIVGEITSSVASEEQLYEFFAANDIQFILEEEAEFLGNSH
jgi:hypothetical protein